ncbi:hypothetical protein C2E23DRAFT_478976 [Lenzites betulinus]|nr:hypothetical protein C2E23DRAFT_478976 [Lenzites betulinus]
MAPVYRLLLPIQGHAALRTRKTARMKAHDSLDVSGHGPRRRSRPLSGLAAGPTDTEVQSSVKDGVLKTEPIHLRCAWMVGAMDAPLRHVLCWQSVGLWGSFDRFVSPTSSRRPLYSLIFPCRGRGCVISSPCLLRVETDRPSQQVLRASQSSECRPAGAPSRGRNLKSQGRDALRGLSILSLSPRAWQKRSPKHPPLRRLIIIFTPWQAGRGENGRSLVRQPRIRGSNGLPARQLNQTRQAGGRGGALPLCSIVGPKA